MPTEPTTTTDANALNDTQGAQTRALTDRLRAAVLLTLRDGSFSARRRWPRVL